jgi:cytoskeletal protein CcmA (bactofilin family)
MSASLFILLTADTIRRALSAAAHEGLPATRQECRSGICRQKYQRYRSKRPAAVTAIARRLTPRFELRTDRHPESFVSSRCEHRKIALPEFCRGNCTLTISTVFNWCCNHIIVGAVLSHGETIRHNLIKVLLGSAVRLAAWRGRQRQRSAAGMDTTGNGMPSGDISSISSEMTVIGKIICKGALKICGVVEGEVIASNALIADGARVQGDIVAEELTIGGRVKGNIHALRVKLQATAVVEGDISHQLLSIDEHAWFEGRSALEDNLPEPRSSVKVESSTPQPWQQVSVEQGEFKADFTKEEPPQLRHAGMHAFLVACIAIIAIGLMSYFALQSTAVRAPKTPQAAPVAQNAPETVAPKARDAFPGPTSMPGTPQAAPVAQNAPETVAPKARDAFPDPEQAPQMAQSLAAPRQTAEQRGPGRAEMAREVLQLPAAPRTEKEAEEQKRAEYVG